MNYVDNCINIPLTIIVKVTGKCNLSCAYCYEGHGKEKDMDDNILETLIKKVAMDSMKRFSTEKSKADFVWHGGEPLLRGVNFFKKVVRAQSAFPEVIFSNRVQSNLTLLTQDYINFFKENNFTIGGSLDGPERIHNISRPMKNGSGSFSAVIRGLRLAKKNNLCVGVITVIGQHNYNHLNEIYEFFKQEGISFEANMLTPDGFAKNNDTIVLTPEEFGQAANSLFDRWFFDTDGDLPISSSIVKHGVAALTGTSLECLNSGRCWNRFMSIDPKGDVYPCGRFSEDVTPEFFMGNILNDSVEEMMLGKAKNMIRSRSAANIRSCKKCAYISECKGGCPYSAYSQNKKLNSPDFFCRGYKLIYSHIQNRVIEELTRVRAAKDQQKL